MTNRLAVRRGVRPRALSLALLLGAGLALAQYSPSATFDLGVGFGQTALSSSILQGTLELSGKSGKSTAPSAYTPDPRLAVRFSEGRLGLFRQRLADQAMKGKSAQEKRTFVAFLKDNDLANGLWVFNAFDKRSPGLPELVATYLGGMWKQVSGTSPDPAKLDALREQLRRSMLQPAQFSKIKAMSAEERLDWMFSLSYDHDALAQDGLFNDDPASRKKRAQLALASAKANGFDLSKLDLK
ncbi:hypothetical protein QR90_06395 [Deinococcus radiopugnans]|uniref:Uncharacterized protein n=1 Tax=Deinococcus radiopugnans TaxID=57497 RepID=A0A0A7KHX5_9DEIO|nr:hypothetical protein [Deinococcus radiopugnans]AIZ44804.1 hypothetical protein QR90_06395 [Deinococcus radiopugnans]